MKFDARAIACNIRSQIEFALAIVAVAAAASAIWYFRTRHLLEAGAFYGFSPTWLADPAIGGPKYFRDFPSGETELLRSLPMLVYPLGGRLGLSGTAIFRVMLVLEILAMVAGSIVATRLLRPSAPRVASLLVAICLIAGTMINCDLARWGMPYYGGVYTYAYGLGMSGSALMITGRLQWGAVLHALAFTVHPVLGLLFVAFTGFAIIANISRYRWRALLQAAATFLVPALVWIAVAMRGAGVTGDAVSADLYFHITRIMSFHWFPITIGVFTTLHDQALVPFVTICILLTVYLFGSNARLAGVERQLAVAFIGILLITAVGIFNAEVIGLPILIKLALHRASAIFLLMAAVVIIPGLWRDFTEGSLVCATLALLILIMPFATKYGVPALLGMALAAATLVEGLRKAPYSQKSIALSIVLCLAIALPAWLVIAKLWSRHSWEAYAAEATILSTPHWAIAITIGLVCVALYLRSQALVIGLVGLAAVLWSPSVKHFDSDATLAQARDYMAVEIWARDKTPPGSLFMPDPVHAYGWREVSQRPSFGSVREWLYSGFIYDTKRDAFDEGLKRFSEFGVKITDYFKLDPIVARNRIDEDVRRQYYTADAAWFTHIHRAYGVDYFVFEKAQLTKRPTIPVVFENASYVVCRPA